MACTKALHPVNRCRSSVSNLVVFSFFIVSFSAICVSSSQIPASRVDGKWEDDDTIIVEATENFLQGDNLGLHEISHARVKRQFYYNYQPHAQPLIPTLVQPAFSPIVRSEPETVRKYSQCMSVQGEAGTCVQLKQCYLFMYGFDLKNNGKYQGNMELARMLRESTGTCGDPGLKNDGRYFYQSNPDQDQESLMEPDLVCCTGNYTDLDIPPMQSLNIVGGLKAPKGKFPFIVALMNNGRQFCGGSMIDSKHVLTAAHCVAHMGGTEVTRLTAQIGDHDIYSSTDGTHQVRKVLRVIKHRRFSPTTLHNDVAILTLTSPVTPASNIQSVGLSSASAGGTATVAGWGRLFDGGQFPSILHYTNVPIWTNEKCRQTYGALAPGGIQEHMMCAGSKSLDACSGDSGGPLVVGGSQVGIVSWGIGCGRYPGVYTRVSSFSSWISKNQKH